MAGALSATTRNTWVLAHMGMPITTDSHQQTETPQWACL